MPIFHTKLIESILEPVAQQVSHLIILHEDGEDGGAMPDLTAPCNAVSESVANLVSVGIETAKNSHDEQLRTDIPRACKQIQEASTVLQQSTLCIRHDPYSVEGRGALIDGARGILSGTSALLLVMDQSEVRKIIRLLKQLIEYTAMAEIVVSVEDAVTFLKNFNPITNSCYKMVTGRAAELVNTAHADMLVDYVKQLKKVVIIFTQAMKLCAVKHQSGDSLDEAQRAKMTLAFRCIDIIHRILRILCYTTDEELETDDEWLNDIRGHLGKMLLLRDSTISWINFQDPYKGVLGELIVRQFLRSGMEIGGISVGSEKDKILGLCDSLQENIENICTMRSNNNMSSPEYRKLTNQVLFEVSDLITACQRVASDQHSRSTRPALNFADKLDQVAHFLRDPRRSEKDSGVASLLSILDTARDMSSTLAPEQMRQVSSMCDDVVSLKNRLLSLSSKGLSNSPEAINYARQIENIVDRLNDFVQGSLIESIENEFLDIKAPVKNLVEASEAPLDVADRKTVYLARCGEFVNASKQLCLACERTVRLSDSKSNIHLKFVKTAEGKIREYSRLLVGASSIVFRDPSCEASTTFLRDLAQHYSSFLEELVNAVDLSVDAASFAGATAASLAKDFEKSSVDFNNSETYAAAKSAILGCKRMARLVQMCDSKLNDWDGVEGFQKLTDASQDLRNDVKSMSTAIKNFEARGDAGSFEQFEKLATKARTDVEKVRQALFACYQSDRPAGDVSQYTACPNINFNIETVPERPPPPVTTPTDVSVMSIDLSAKPEETFAMVNDDTRLLRFPEPEVDAPIMQAAYSLHMTAQRWQSSGNDLIAAAKKMPPLMAQVHQNVNSERGDKRVLISLTKLISSTAMEVYEEASVIAKKCQDRSLRQALQQIIAKIPTLSTQLKIVSTVKASMIGRQGTKEDDEATEALVWNAENLMKCIEETVGAAMSASIRFTPQLYTIRWKRKIPIASF